MIAVFKYFSLSIISLLYVVRNFSTFNLKYIYFTSKRCSPPIIKINCKIIYSKSYCLHFKNEIYSMCEVEKSTLFVDNLENNNNIISLSYQFSKGILSL